MGAIEDIYADLDADVPEEEFREAVEQKVEQMGGLADEETAAMLIAHELADNEVGTIADIDPSMDEVKFLAKVTAIGDLRTFDRDGEDEDGKVINVEAADETGTVRLAFWDEWAEAIADGELDAGKLEEGTVLRVKGRPKEGYNGLEVSVMQAEPDEEAEIEVDMDGPTTVDSLSMGQSDVNLRGLVLDTGEVRTFDRDDGSEGRVANLTLGDESGRIRVTLWDDRADRATTLETGAAVEIIDGYVREREGELELHVGDRGAVEEIDDAVEYEPNATAIEAAEIGTTVDLAGVVRSTDPKRTFDRDDGSEGQVRNIRIQDETGDMRVALWGEKADKDIAPGDEVLAADVEIQDGWQDDLEASAGWQSAVVVLADGSESDNTGAAEDAQREQPPSGTRDADGASAGLGAFADGTGPDSSSGASTNGDDADADRREFTGTVVQTGNPIKLDNGAETISVETDERLQLGEEVTARGQLNGERLDADEIL